MPAQSPSYCNVRQLTRYHRVTLRWKVCDFVADFLKSPLKQGECNFLLFPETKAPVRSHHPLITSVWLPNKKSSKANVAGWRKQRQLFQCCVQTLIKVWISSPQVLSSFFPHTLSSSSCPALHTRAPLSNNNIYYSLVQAALLLLFWVSRRCQVPSLPPWMSHSFPSAVSGRGADSGIVLFRFLLSHPFTNPNTWSFYVDADTSRLGDGLLLKKCLCCGQVWLQQWLPRAGWGAPPERSKNNLHHVVITPKHVCVTTFLSMFQFDYILGEKCNLFLPVCAF